MFRPASAIFCKPQQQGIDGNIVRIDAENMDETDPWQFVNFRVS
jgi:hypothetical protein